MPCRWWGGWVDGTREKRMVRPFSPPKPPRLPTLTPPFLPSEPTLSARPGGAGRPPLPRLPSGARGARRPRRTRAGTRPRQRRLGRGESRRCPWPLRAWCGATHTELAAIVLLLADESVETGRPSHLFALLPGSAAPLPSLSQPLFPSSSNTRDAGGRSCAGGAKPRAPTAAPPRAAERCHADADSYSRGGWRRGRGARHAGPGECGALKPSAWRRLGKWNSAAVGSDHTGSSAPAGRAREQPFPPFPTSPPSHPPALHP